MSLKKHALGVATRKSSPKTSICAKGVIVLNAKHVLSAGTSDISEKSKHGRIDSSIQNKNALTWLNITTTTKSNSPSIVENLKKNILITTESMQGNGKRNKKSAEVNPHSHITKDCYVYNQCRGLT